MRREDQTPEYREMIAERRRARDRAKSKRRKAERRAAKLVASPLHAASKTDPVMRRRLHGVAPEMTKSQLRDVIAQAFRNTAESING